MAYLSQFASNVDYGVIRVGNGIVVSNGTISVQANSGSAITGTWLPAIASSQTATITLNITNAKYVKVGQLVVCTFDFTVSVESGGSSSGQLTITGLPFTSITDTGYVGSLSISYFNNMNTDTGSISGSVVNNSTTINLWRDAGGSNTKTLTNLTQNDIKVSTRLVGVVEYVSAT